MINHLHLDDDRADDGERRAVLVRADGERRELWFRRYGGPLAVATGADPFLIATMLWWMADGRPLRVHGPVSRRLLTGLDEWQAVWARWRPGRYSPVAVEPDDVVAAVPATTAGISAFSGGVDGGYTLRRHLTGAVGWRTVDLRAALLLHGFDLPLADPGAFDRARARIEGTLAGTGLRLEGLATNLRALDQEWEDAFGAAVAAGLTALAPEYGVGLIAAGGVYSRLQMPWGSSPVLDHWCSSGLMEIRHDGAEARRIDKVALLAGWPEGMRNVRVCWQGEHPDRNCGRCEKCVRTVLEFRVVGAGLPASFEHDVDDELIRRTAIPNPAVLHLWEAFVAEAERRGIDAPWVAAARFAVRRGRATLAVRGSRPWHVAGRVRRALRVH